MNDQEKWEERNEQHLAASVKWIRLGLQRLSPPARPKLVERKGCNWFKRSAEVPARVENPKQKAPTDEAIEQAFKEMVELEDNNPPPALVLLARYLGLSQFDRHVFALCAAVELDTRIAGLCAGAQDDPNRPYPTFALAFALFEDPEWGAMSPHAPLRHWRLIEINQPGAQPLTGSALRADERIVNYIKELNYLDDRLTPLVDTIAGQSRFRPTSAITPTDRR